MFNSAMEILLVVNNFEFKKAVLDLDLSLSITFLSRTCNMLQ